MKEKTFEPKPRKAFQDRTLHSQIESAIRQAVASGTDEAKACRQVMDFASSRMNRAKARQSLKMVIQ